MSSWGMLDLQNFKQGFFFFKFNTILMSSRVFFVQIYWRALPTGGLTTTLSWISFPGDIPAPPLSGWTLFPFKILPRKGNLRIAWAFMSGLEKKKRASMVTMSKPIGTLGKSRSLGRSTKWANVWRRVGKRMTVAMIRLMFRSGFLNFPLGSLWGFHILTKMPTPQRTDEVPTAEKRSNGLRENWLEASSLPVQEINFYLFLASFKFTGKIYQATQRYSKEAKSDLSGMLTRTGSQSHFRQLLLVKFFHIFENKEIYICQHLWLEKS